MIEIIPNWHPVFVHFTVALISVAAPGLLAARLFAGKTWSQPLQSVALFNLWLGSLITIATVAAGFYAYNTVTHDTPSHLAMTDHRNWALATAVFIVVFAGWAAFAFRRDKAIRWPIVIFGLITNGMVIATAWHGGEVVYRHGIGVMSLPKTDAHQHSAGETDEHGHGSTSTHQNIDMDQSEEAESVQTSESQSDHNDAHTHAESDSGHHDDQHDHGSHDH